MTKTNVFARVYRHINMYIYVHTCIVIETSTKIWAQEQRGIIFGMKFQVNFLSFPVISLKKKGGGMSFFKKWESSLKKNSKEEKQTMILSQEIFFQVIMCRFFSIALCVFLIRHHYTWSMTSISCSLFFISSANCSLIIVSIFCTAASRAT